MIRVFIVTPAIAVRAGLRSLLLDDTRIQVVGEANSLDEVEEGQVDADVVIWSPISSLDLDTIPTQLANLKLGVPTALLLIHDDPKVIEKLIRLPVRGWGMLSPESTQAEIIASVEALNEGLAVTNPLWLQHLPAGEASGNGELATMVEPLTGRETEILQLLALGLTNKQIALRLGISAHTVKFHVSSIFGKMGTTNRTETVKLGLKMGLILL